MLKRLGYQAEAVVNGQEALDAMSQGVYDLVLMDVQMPELDGVEATRIWRGRERAEEARRLPIVAMTAHASTRDRDLCLEAGMDGFLTKPIQRAMLGEALKRYLDGHSDGALKPVPAGTPILAPGPAFQVSDLMRRLEADETLAREVAQVFLLEADRLMARAEQALTAGDAAVLRESAHSLKGAAGNIGAAHLHEAAHQLESLGRAGRLDDAHILFGDFRRRVEATNQVLREFLEAAPA
jgi:two-component system, sensor histidine kinase and response regulator